MTELLVIFPCLRGGQPSPQSVSHSSDRKQTCWNLAALTDLSSTLLSYSYKSTPLPTTQIHGGPEG